MRFSKKLYPGLFLIATVAICLFVSQNIAFAQLPSEAVITVEHSTLSTAATDCEYTDIETNMYWDKLTGEYITYFLVGYIQYNFDSSKVEFTGVTSGTWNPTVLSQGDGYVILSLWQFNPTDPPDPESVAYTLTFHGIDTGTAAIEPEMYSRDGFLSGSVHGWYTIPVEFTTGQRDLVNELRQLIEEYYASGYISSKGIYNSLMSSLDTIEAKLEENNYNAALGEINAMINLVEAQRGNKINTPQADILLEKLNYFYNRVALDDFCTELPLVLVISQSDTITVTLQDYPAPQEIYLSGEFRHILFQSPSDDNTVQSILTYFESSSTALYIPSIGMTVPLNISLDPFVSSQGIINKDLLSFSWELNATVDIGTGQSIDISFFIEDDITFSTDKTMSLASSGSGTIDNEFPVFGGAVFSFMPGSGCEQKSKSRKLKPYEESLRLYLEFVIKQAIDNTAAKTVLAAVQAGIQNSKFTITDAIGLLSDLADIFHSICHGGTTTVANVEILLFDLREKLGFDINDLILGILAVQIGESLNTAYNGIGGHKKSEDACKKEIEIRKLINEFLSD